MQNREQAKLADAILYFVANTNYCYLTKLLKLLYFLDFQHYRETGRPVTGLEYVAWDSGPVNGFLYGCLRHDGQFRDVVRAESLDTRVLDWNPIEIIPLREYSGRHLTQREKRILQTLAERFRDTRGEEMINATHEPREPWTITYKDGEGKNELVSYDLALETGDQDRIEELRERAQEHRENKAVLS